MNSKTSLLEQQKQIEKIAKERGVSFAEAMVETFREFLRNDAKKYCSPFYVHYPNAENNTVFPLSQETIEALNNNVKTIEEPTSADFKRLNSDVSCEVKHGKVERVKIVFCGSGYTSQPKL